MPPSCLLFAPCSNGVLSARSNGISSYVRVKIRVDPDVSRAWGVRMIGAWETADD